MFLLQFLSPRGPKRFEFFSAQSEEKELWRSLHYMLFGDLNIEKTNLQWGRIEFHKLLFSQVLGPKCMVNRPSTNEAYKFLLF